VGEPQRDWDQRYQTGDLPWDSGIRSRELARVISEGEIAPCRTVELGCGTGTNAVFLAEQHFEVTAFDLSPTAIERAKQRAEAAHVSVHFLEADLLKFNLDLEPFEFLFDRGCFHCARKVDLAGYRETLKKLSKPGTRYLLLTGNANEQNEHEGPPRLQEQEIREDLSELFEVDFLREIHFEDAGGLEGPLGWSCLMTRR
jgi:methyl halide transferase